MVYTMTHIAMTATNLGYKVWYRGVGNFVFGLDEYVSPHVRQAQIRHYRSIDVYTSFPARQAGYANTRQVGPI